MVGVPGGGGAFDVVGGDEALALLAQPAGQVVPLAQQAFQGDLHDHLAAALVLDQQPLFDERLDQRPAGLGQVAVAGDPAHGLVVVGVDGGQPRDERRPQRSQLTAALRRIGRQHLVDGGLHHPLHAAHRLIAGEGQLAGAWRIGHRAGAASTPTAAARPHPRRHPRAAG